MNDLKEQMSDDISRHFSSKLKRLIVDTCEVCEFGELDSRHTFTLVLAGLMEEVGFMCQQVDLDPDQFVEMAKLSFQHAAVRAKRRERER